MYNVIYTIHGHNDSLVSDVMAEMRVLGAPTIRVVDCGDHYMAIEGTHRLASACNLGIAPRLEVLEQGDMVDADSLDLDCLAASETYTAGEIASEVYTDAAGIYRREDDGTLVLVANGLFIPS